MVYNSSQSTGIQSKNQMPVWLQLNPGVTMRKEFMGSVIFTVRTEFSSELFLHECYIWLSVAIVFEWMFFTDTTLRKCSIIMPTFLSPMWTQMHLGQIHAFNFLGLYMLIYIYLKPIGEGKQLYWNRV